MEIFVDPDRPLRYTYRADNRSLVDKYLLRHWWPLAIKAIPRRAPANLVSMVGNLGSYFSFLVLAGLLFGPVSAAGLEHPWIFGLVAFGYFFYQTLDALDGIQARRTGSSGPLGEFVDHWFDSFNVFLLPLGLALAFPVVPYQLAAAALLVFAAADWFQLRAMASLEVLVFPPVSSEEGQVLDQLFFVLIWILGYSLFARPLLLGLPFITIGYLVLLAGMSWTALSCAKDSAKALQYFPQLLSLAPISAWILIMYPRIGGTALLVGGLLLGFSGSRFSGELLRERLVGTRYRPFIPDIFAVDALILATAAPPALPAWIPLAAAWVSLAWTALALIRQFVRTVARVRAVTGRGLLWPLTA
ncbi:MAG TPA: CDP-alcohol phosphatidyltransferase family protein [Rectinemataceae bacterium]|nr:CDP-alcohol phosphatidyltransferase family protein [Rectinemataceae bacterium]